MSLKKHLHKNRIWLSAIAMAASLVACGGGGDSNGSAPDPLQSYRDQTLQWAPCDESILGWSEEKTWAQLGDRLQCSTLRVPMDWAQPERSDVWVSVMRVAAADPAQRRGAVLFNPGGPGGDGLGLALDLFTAFGQSNPQSTQGALQLRLLASYDMVGFSPRGTGASTRLTCGTNELKRFVDPSPLALTDANLANAAYNDRKAAEACARNPLTPYISTDATARDMDLLRQLLGEAKLNYVGYSYGTWLGSWYANLFPDRVGRMVLDSAMDFTRSHEQTFIAMLAARQQLHEEVLLPYAARHNPYFGLGSSSADINAQLQALSAPVQGLLSTTLGNLTYSRSDADRYLDTLRAALGLDQALRALPDLADEGAVDAALQQQVFNASDSGRNQAVRTRARDLYGDYRSLYVKFEPSSIQLDELYATFWAVTCSNSPATTDPDAWKATVRSSALRAPWFFFDPILENPCVYWAAPRTAKPGVAAMQGLDILMVQSQYDGATPSEGATHFFAQLPNARRVYVPGEFQHGVFPYSDSCVDSTVVRYLLGETPKERETACQAKPLQQDAPVETVAPAELQAAPQTPPAAGAKTLPKAAARAADAPGASPGTAPPTYLDPEEAQRRIDRFKDGIGRRR